MQQLESCDYVVVGAGLSGLAAALALGNGCTVLETCSEPGGLVRSVRIGSYWFDRVLHLLYFPDDATRDCFWPLIGIEGSDASAQLTHI